MAPTIPSMFSQTADLIMTFEDSTFAPIQGPDVKVSGGNPLIVQNSYNDGSSRSCLRVNSEVNVLNLDADFFQMGQGDFTIQMDMKRDMYKTSHIDN